jgi:uncharacterized protein YndB with AHSA1/START domain
MPSEKSSSFAESSMAIRKPVDLVFQAFIEPEITTNFWFTKSTGPLVQGKKVEWFWEMYGVSAPVDVVKIDKNKSIEINWGNGGQKSKVAWTFQAVNESLTYVKIINDEFQSTGDDLIAAIRDSTQGFSFLLSSLKAYLEHGVKLNLVDDKWPPEMR